MAKLLDLDAILPPNKEIKIGGEKYPIVEMTVGLFAALKRFEDKDMTTMSPIEQMAAYVDLVKEVIPTVPSNVIDRMTAEQLKLIFSFAMEQANEENEAAAGDEAK